MDVNKLSEVQLKCKHKWKTLRYESTVRNGQMDYDSRHICKKCNLLFINLGNVQVWDEPQVVLSITPWNM